MEPTNRVLMKIRECPGLTQAELAKALFGNSAYPQSVQRECETLLKLSLIDRSGCGGRYDPYTYHPWPKPPKQPDRRIP